MTPENMAYLAEVVRSRSGLILAPDKAYLVESRLGPVARRRELGSVEALLDAMRAEPCETLMWAVTDALTTNETFFFRDKQPFEQFREQVLPKLSQARPNGTLKVWSAACSTGQEPYSLAMMMDGLPDRRLKLDICASDISERCLEKAQSGLYTQFEVQRGLPIAHLLKHFEKVDEAWRIRPEIRQQVRWRRFNLLDDMTPLGRFDVVFLRNVLIYFDPETKRRVLDAVAAVLEPDGFLFLGASETVTGLTEAFLPAPGQAGLFARNPDFSRAA